jgi:hypothetical protein
MREFGGLQELSPQVQRHARVSAGAVPERVVVASLQRSGTWSGRALISWRHNTSGRSRSTHSQSCASRARMPFTFQVAIFMWTQRAFYRVRELAYSSAGIESLRTIPSRFVRR